MTKYCTSSLQFLSLSLDPVIFKLLHNHVCCPHHCQMNPNYCQKIKKNAIHWLYLLLRLTIAHPLKKVMASKIKLLARKSHFNNDLKQQSPGASLINFSTNIYWSQNFSHQATWVKCRFHNSVNIWSDKVYSIFKFISKLQTKSVWFFRV